MTAIGMMHRAGNPGGDGKRLHLIQLENRIWRCVCRIDDERIVGEPVAGRGTGDVTCKRCVRFLARRWSRK